MRNTLLSLIFVTCLSNPFAEPEVVPPYMDCLIKANSLPFVSETAGYDIWYPPNVALKRNKGDCEEHAFLLYDYLDKKEIKSRVVFGYMEGNKQKGHAWVELVHEGTTYILDQSILKIYEKAKIVNDRNNLDYIEYDPSLGFQKDCKELIKRFKKGDNNAFINNYRKFSF